MMDFHKFMPTQTLISLTLSDNEKNRKLLLNSIKKKRLQLQKLVVRSELLRTKLDMLKREYMVKIGSLVLKDNQLDFEMIRLRNMISLMKEGKTFDEAEKELEDTFYAEQLEIDKESENIRNAERVFEKSKEWNSDEEQQKAKKLFRKLIALFHPDLSQDEVEKRRREDIMKQINQAYEEGDITWLSRIESEHATTQETPVNRLEDILVMLENEIFEHEKEFTLLKESEWYKWHIKISKTQKTISDIFSDVEKKLLDDIVGKIIEVRELQKTIELVRYH